MTFQKRLKENRSVAARGTKEFLRLMELLDILIKMVVSWLNAFVKLVEL